MEPNFKEETNCFVLEVITLRCLPSVSRANPIGGYVSLVKGDETVVKMSALNWKPFVYGGLASITAECGKGPEGPRRSFACYMGFFFF